MTAPATNRYAGRPATRVPARTSAQIRAGKIAQLHIAKTQLNMAEDQYRQAISEASHGRTVSSKDLHDFELDNVLAHMRRCGFTPTKPKAAQSSRSASARPTTRKVPSDRPLDMHATSSKIRAIWLMMHQMGVVKNPSEAALGAYVKRQTGVEALQWIDGAQAEKLIEALKKWAMRYLPERCDARVDELTAPMADSMADIVRLARIEQAVDTSSAYRMTRPNAKFESYAYLWMTLNDIVPVELPPAGGSL